MENFTRSCVNTNVVGKAFNPPFMNVSFENVEKFEKALGSLVIEFSKLEFSLTYYCALIENPYNHTAVLRKYLGSELKAKRNKIKSFIYTNLEDLKTEWDVINSKIGSINQERRHLIHGIGRSYFLLDAIKTIIKKGDEIVSKEYSVNDIKIITDKLSHLLTGDNGLEGEFLVKFTSQLFDNLNKKVLDDKKVVYRVNGEILTEWKG